MAARSTGLFPREGFNLDAEMQVPENAGGDIALLGDLSKAKTIRVIFVAPVITGDGSIELYLNQAGDVYRAYTSADIKDGMIIDHIRGAAFDSQGQDMAYLLVQGLGSAAVDSCYIELVDGVRR